MKKLHFFQLVGWGVGAVIVFLNLPLLAQESPNFYTGEWPNASGDYPIRQEYSGSWRVVDLDTNGLNCRKNIPPGGGSEEVAERFPPNTLITLVKRQRGVFEIETDQQGKPWLRVQLPNGLDCWVRANQQYVVPVK